MCKNKDIQLLIETCLMQAREMDRQIVIWMDLYYAQKQGLGPYKYIYHVKISCWYYINNVKDF